VRRQASEDVVELLVANAARDSGGHAWAVSPSACHAAPLSGAGLAGSALLICYGAVEVAGEALAETGAIRPAAPDWTALRWHLALWDPWFLVWGLLLGPRHFLLGAGRGWVSLPGTGRR